MVTVDTADTLCGSLACGPLLNTISPDNVCGSPPLEDPTAFPLLIRDALARSDHKMNPPVPRPFLNTFHHLFIGELQNRRKKTFA